MLGGVFGGGLGASASAQDWPAFRGPRGDGTTEAKGAPVSWDAERNIRWRTPLARPANGSPIVVGDRVFLTMPEDEEGRGRSLLCFARRDGALRWSRTVSIGRRMPTHRTNPYGGTTPASDGDSVVVWHASAGLHCYSLEGEPRWGLDLGEFSHEWGYGSSPVIHEAFVLLQSGPGDGCFLAAFDLGSGTQRWRLDEPASPPEEGAARRMVGSWSTPVVVQSGERELVVCALPSRVVACAVEDGSVVWSCEGLRGQRGDLVYSSPMLSREICCVQAGYEGPALALRLGGEGDVTQSHRLWHHDSRMSNVGTGLSAPGCFLVPEISGFLWCIDARTGEPRWRERLGRGQIWGSIVSAGGVCYVTNQEGTTFVFRPDPSELVIVSENALGETTNATPAIAGEEIFLRTHESLVCVGEEGR